MTIKAAGDISIPSICVTATGKKHVTGTGDLKMQPVRVSGIGKVTSKSPPPNRAQWRDLIRLGADLARLFDLFRDAMEWIGRMLRQSDKKAASS